MTILLFEILFAGSCLAALRWPIVGLLAYMVNYLIAPDRQWWGEPLHEMGARFSMLLVLATAAGLLFQWRKFRSQLPGSAPHSQEVLVVLFVIVVLLSRLWGVAFDDSARDLSGISMAPHEKMPKVAFFVFLLTTLAARYSQFRSVLWLLALVGGLYLGWDGYTAPRGRFSNGRLDYLGGADFAESSAVGAHLVVVAVITGVLFLKSQRFWQKGLCLLIGAFTLNAIVLTQTRAAFLGLLAAGMAAPLFAMKGKRLMILGHLALAGAGAFYLTNDRFWSRIETINASEVERDESAESRIELWAAGMHMWQANPMGVGAGSFYTAIGTYDSRHANRDCHNTYIRCGAELGVLGALIFGGLIVNAFLTLRRAGLAAAGTSLESDLRWDCFGLQVAFVGYFVSGIFMGLTYIEEMWWFLCLPVCLERAALNARLEQDTLELPFELSNQGSDSLSVSPIA
jgi:O-antigen ligase